jgi:hypothetical protein
VNRPTPEFEAMVESNVWHDDLLVTVGELLKLVSDWPKWQWVKNTRPVKYITIKVDMRDGGFVMLDDDKKRISLEQVRWQFPKTKETS